MVWQGKVRDRDIVVVVVGDGGGVGLQEKWSERGDVQKGDNLLQSHSS